MDWTCMDSFIYLERQKQNATFVQLSFLCEVYESMLKTGVSANSEKQGDSCLTNVSKCRSNVVEQTRVTCATAV